MFCDACWCGCNGCERHAGLLGLVREVAEEDSPLCCPYCKWVDWTCSTLGSWYARDMPVVFDAMLGWTSGRAYIRHLATKVRREDLHELIPSALLVLEYVDPERRRDEP